MDKNVIMNYWKEANWMSREQIISDLESIGIACYDDESTQELRECWVENKESKNI